MYDNKTKKSVKFTNQLKRKLKDDFQNYKNFLEGTFSHDEADIRLTWDKHRHFLATSMNPLQTTMNQPV